MHHAFTSPKAEFLDTFDTDPGSALAYAYDIVCNGNEIGGGSIRIHRRDIQERVFAVMGLIEDEAQEKFGFLLDAFAFGAPPHGGIAFGWDRICALLSGTESIRDVIAFPKTGGGYDPLTAAPAPITAEQRKEAGIDAATRARDRRPPTRMTDRDLFTSAGDEVAAGRAPLAVRMRPALPRRGRRPGPPARRRARRCVGWSTRRPTARPPVSLLLWGPPGTGKTTLAYLVAQATEREFVELSAVNAGVKDVRLVIDDARRAARRRRPRDRAVRRRGPPVLQDPAGRAAPRRGEPLGHPDRRDDGEPALLDHRSAPVAQRPADAASARGGRRTRSARTRRHRPARPGRLGRRSAPDALDQLVRLAGGDARWALTALEAAAGTAGARTPSGTPHVTAEDVEIAIDRAAVRYDRQGDQHYDITSALIKSIRGSDVDAALHYLARMVEAGEDLRFIARRLVISASEDVGLADPTRAAD